LLSDLSFWDFAQDNYLDTFLIEELHPAYTALHEAKFGVKPSLPQRTDTLTLNL
jgi:hypothetical protein